MTPPLLMPFQDQPFNGDTFIQNKVLELKKKFAITTAIETGSCLMGTTVWLYQNFDYIWTVELSVDYRTYGIAFLEKALGKQYPNEIPNLVSVVGSSIQALPHMLKAAKSQTRIGEQLFIFLDAHWGDDCPLEKELEIIADSGMEPIIAIHDFFVPGKSEELGYDSYKGQAFKFEWLRKKIEDIYGDRYEIEYNSEAEGAKRGIIYITPVKK